MIEVRKPPLDNSSVACRVIDEAAASMLCERREMLSNAQSLSAQDVFTCVVVLNKQARRLYPSGAELARELVANYELGLAALLQSPAFMPEQKKDEFVLSHLSISLSRHEEFLVNLPPDPTV